MIFDKGAKATQCRKYGFFKNGVRKTGHLPYNIHRNYLKMYQRLKPYEVCLEKVQPLLIKQEWFT